VTITILSNGGVSGLELGTTAKVERRPRAVDHSPGPGLKVDLASQTL
jgi:hypothetical protein